MTMKHPTFPVHQDHLETTSEVTSGLDLVLLPETRPISHEQLLVEVKGIHAGLIRLETQCIEIEEMHLVSRAGYGSSEDFRHGCIHWNTLVALHKRLLDEHHDFFLASQRPLPSSALRNLACKYTMPASMWKHGSHPFFHVSRRTDFCSRHHTLAFIYSAYSMMGLLHETVPVFEDTSIDCPGDLGPPAIGDTWIECLGDLGRYRLATEENERTNHTICKGLAKHRYHTKSLKGSSTAHQSRHLVILAHFPTLKLIWNMTPVSYILPSHSSSLSLIISNQPIHAEDGSHQHRSLETGFIGGRRMLFCPEFSISGTLYSLLMALQTCIGQPVARFQELGLDIAIPNMAGIFGRGALQHTTWTDCIKSDRCTRGTLVVENSRRPLPEDFATRGFTWFLPISENLDTRNSNSTSHISARLSWLPYFGQQVG